MDDSQFSFSFRKNRPIDSMSEYLAPDIEEAYEDCERYESNLEILEENLY